MQEVEGSIPSSSILLRPNVFTFGLRRNEPGRSRTQEMHIVYILTSLKNPAKYYIGTTENLPQRLEDHNNQRSGYTPKYAPWKIETFIDFQDYTLAQAFEKYLKSGSGFAFLKKRLIPQIKE